MVLWKRTDLQYAELGISFEGYLSPKDPHDDFKVEVGDVCCVVGGGFGHHDGNDDARRR